MTPLYPLKLPPSLRPKIWGTRDLSPIYSEQDEEIGEAWFSFEENSIANGPFAGQTLGELVERLGRRLMGSSYEPSSLRRRSAGEADRAVEQSPQFYFPVLSKLLFTSQKLSVQVHPDDAYAMTREGGPGKTEMWYIVDAKPDAKLVLGLTREMSRLELSRAAASGEIEKDLNWVPIQKGQTIFITPGTLHTIGPGIVICEIQQNSDLTYRFYDFGRKGPDGRPRPLHIEQASVVTKQVPHTGALAPFRFFGTTDAGVTYERELLAACRYFASERLSWSGESLYRPDPFRFHLLIFLEGTGTLAGEDWETASYQPGEAYLIPAECATIRLAAESSSVAIRAYVPDLVKLREEVAATGAPSNQYEPLFAE